MILRASESPDLFEEKFRALALAEEEAQKQHDEARGDVSAAATPNSVASQPTGLQPSLMPQAKDKAVLVPKDTHFFETRAYFQRVMVPIRIPMTTFEEDVGDVSRVPPLPTGTPCNDTMLTTVLADRAGHALRQWTTLSRTIPSTSPHQRHQHQSRHPHHQRHDSAQTCPLSGSQPPRKSRIPYGPRRLCYGFRLWSGPKRSHRDRLSLCQPGFSRHLGRASGLRRWRDQSPL